MNDADAETDFTVLEHLDFETPCSSMYNFEPCPEVAEWYVDRTPCPACGLMPAVLCTLCKDYAISINGWLVFCAECGAEYTMHVIKIEAL